MCDVNLGKTVDENAGDGLVAVADHLSGVDAFEKMRGFICARLHGSFRRVQVQRCPYLDRQSRATASRRYQKGIVAQLVACCSGVKLSAVDALPAGGLAVFFDPDVAADLISLETEQLRLYYLW